MAYNADNEKKEMIGDLWSNSRGDSIKVQKVTNKTSGTVNADIRRYYTNDDDKVMPTQKGIRINAELIPELIKMLAGMLEYSELDTVQSNLSDMLEAMDADEEEEDADGAAE